MLNEHKTNENTVNKRDKLFVEYNLVFVFGDLHFSLKTFPTFFNDSIQNAIAEKWMGTWLSPPKPS
jgi:hypothetical protein